MPKPLHQALRFNRWLSWKGLNKTQMKQENGDAANDGGGIMQGKGRGAGKTSGMVAWTADSEFVSNAASREVAYRTCFLQL